MQDKTEFQKIDESLTEQDFDSNGLYVDENDQVHIAPWLKVETDLRTKRVLDYLRAGGDIRGRN